VWRLLDISRGAIICPSCFGDLSGSKTSAGLVNVFALGKHSTQQPVIRCIPIECWKRPSETFADYGLGAQGDAKADRPAKRSSAAGNRPIAGPHSEVRQ
jgi:hypothetical protein